MNKSKFSKPIVFVPLAMLCCFLWGSAFPTVKTGYALFNIGADDSFSQILFAGVRFALAGILVLVIGCLMSKKLLLPKNKTQIGHIAVLGLFQTVLQYIMFYIGLAHTSGVKSSILVAVNVFMSLIISALVFKMEKLTFQKTAGVVLGFAGVVIINLTSASSLGGFSIKGEGAILLSAFAYSVSSVLIKKYSQTDNPVMLSGWQFFAGGVFMIVFGLIAGGKFIVEPSETAKSLLILFYLAFISAVAYTVWGILLKYNPVSNVAVMGFMNPVFGVLLSAAILGETAEAFSFKNLISLLLVCVGIFIVNKDFRKKT